MVITCTISFFMMIFFGERLFKEKNIDKCETNLVLKDKNLRDPLYTGDFDETYEDIDVGTNRILNMFKVEF